MEGNTEFPKPTELGSSKLTRKQFLSIAARAAVGALVSEAVIPGKLAVIDTAQKLGIAPGTSYTADLDMKVQEQCGPVKEVNDCVKEALKPTIPEIMIKDLGSPIVEEASLRALPVYLNDRALISNFHGEKVTEDIKRDILFGHRRITLTRREFVLGCLTSSVFAGIHAIPEKSESFRLPVSQVIGGLERFYLQVVFGYPAAVADHMYNNMWATKQSYR